MNTIVCNYAPICFAPFPDTGEFINVGVVVHCPQTGHFDFRLMSPDGASRVHSFFPTLDPNLFTLTMSGVARQLRQVEQAQAETKRGADEFNELIRRREGIVYFGEAGSMLSESAEKGLEELYGRYVERHIAPELKFGKAA